jgi:hypothetical protein
VRLPNNLPILYTIIMSYRWYEAEDFATAGTNELDGGYESPASSGESY